ncbi:hypothetical protein OAS39_11335, partial [Pirellulales bacterium]|nr:hypothetical protein [Pirellulales bacterium]
AADNASAASLPDALAGGQAAYQSLLRLRAREFAVVAANSGQQQQGSSSGSATGAGSRAQQQLQQLELSAERNRYETESRALDSRQQAQSAQQQSRAALDRLRELARRQQDLNERVRELQSELQAAQTREERDESERELKRLREQQRELLRDSDKLQDDLQNSGDPEQFQQAQQQLDETRNRVQQAGEAMEQGRLAEALTEGTRAQRELEQLADEFRRHTADQFNEQLNDLRESARQIEQRQQQLAEEIAERQPGQNRSLRDGAGREEVLQGLAEQQRQVQELLEQMQELVQEAEEPEPLLARELYETILQANEDDVERALDITRELAEFGANQQAAEALQEVDPGIERLREGVERAAENVLGDETEALRRAQQQLDELAEQLSNEISEALGEPTNPGGPITGDEYRAWDDAFRNAQDLLDDSDLRAEAARIRDRAEAARADYMRRSKVPNWKDLLETVAEPLDELRSRIGDEIRRRESPDDLAPIERDRAPSSFQENVRRYYERLGEGA